MKAQRRVLLSAFAGTASAFDERAFQFQLAGPIIAGPGRAQLRGEMSGTIANGPQDVLVGDLTVQLLQNPFGCPPALSVVHPAGTDSFYVFWAVDCMTPGDQVVLRFSTVSGVGPLQVAGAEWVNLSGGTAGAIWQEVPIASSIPRWAVPVLALLMALAAVLHIRRQRRTIHTA